ncbi:MAG TPA: sugar phosphate isomerase/epimerase family protein [Bryobacteraceae bacterium]|nr:sugar phosphate isomerase/epimerase family protein [Bryobacteraceae bacterium]
MLRREFLAAAAVTPLLAASNHIGKSRISAISDEIAKSPEEAIAFAKQYGLQWLELRGVPGAKTHYSSIPEEQVKQAAREFKDNGIRISFFNTGYLKFGFPGTEVVRRKGEEPAVREKRIAREQAQYDSHMEDLKQGIRAAHILGVDKMRVFTFLRVAEPEKLSQRIADVIGEMAEIAGKEKIRLVVENEGSCNVGTSAELAAFMKLLPEKVGLNWDPQNGLSLKEIPFPDGYQLLPKKRILNVQVKGHGLLDEKLKLDWPAIVRALEKDGYPGKIGLETHYFDGTVIEKSHRAMREILRIVES